MVMRGPAFLPLWREKRKTILGTMSITGGPERDPVTDVASPYAGGTNPTSFSETNRADDMIILIQCPLSSSFVAGDGDC